MLPTLQLAFPILLLLVEPSTSQGPPPYHRPYGHHPSPYRSHYDPYTGPGRMFRRPLLPPRLAPHLSRLMPRPLLRNSYAASARQYPYRYVPPSGDYYYPQSMHPSANRYTYNQAYYTPPPAPIAGPAPPPPPLPQPPPPPPAYPVASSPYRRMSSYSAKSAPYDMLSSASSSTNAASVRYVPVVKRVTHHHIHHLVPPKKTSSQSPAHVAKLNDLLIKSLYKLHGQKSSQDSINLLADASTPTLTKVSSTVRKPNTGYHSMQHEVEADSKDTKQHVNHEVAFEDEETVDEQSGVVQMFRPKNKSEKSVGLTKEVQFHRFKPGQTPNTNPYITLMKELSKGHNLEGKLNKKAKGPNFSLFIGVPDQNTEDHQMIEHHQFEENSSIDDNTEEQEEYVAANRRMDGETDTKGDNSKPGKAQTKESPKISQNNKKIDISEKLVLSPLQNEWLNVENYVFN